MSPAWHGGLLVSARELATRFLLRIYEHLAVWRLGMPKAECLVRDSRSWIRDVLSLQHKAKPATTRFIKYFSAAVHAGLLGNVADFTVTVLMHTHHSLTRPGNRNGIVVFWLKGVGMHAVRCFITWLLVSMLQSSGGLVHASYGTAVGQQLGYFISSGAMAVVVQRYLQ